MMHPMSMHITAITGKTMRPLGFLNQEVYLCCVVGRRRLIHH